MNLLDFEVKGHKRPRGQITTLGGIFWYIYVMHGYNLMKLTAFTHYQVHMTLIIVGS